MGLCDVSGRAAEREARAVGCHEKGFLERGQGIYGKTWQGSEGKQRNCFKAGLDRVGDDIHVSGVWHCMGQADQRLPPLCWTFSVEQEPCDKKSRQSPLAQHVSWQPEDCQLCQWERLWGGRGVTWWWTVIKYFFMLLACWTPMILICN